MEPKEPETKYFGKASAEAVYGGKEDHKAVAIHFSAKEALNLAINILKAYQESDKDSIRIAVFFNSARKDMHTTVTSKPKGAGDLFELPVASIEKYKLGITAYKIPI